MIDISAETLRSPAEIAQRVPRRRDGKPCHIATIYRWMTNGVRGIRLESLLVGGTRCTSDEALQRFFEALTLRADGTKASSPAPTTASRRKKIAAAERKLEKMGV